MRFDDPGRGGLDTRMHRCCKRSKAILRVIRRRRGVLDWIASIGAMMGNLDTCRPLCGPGLADYALWSRNCICRFRSSRRVALMGYRSLQECVRDLERTGQLAVIDQEVDPRLEAAAIQRRVYQAGGPAIYFARVKGTRFPAGVQPVRNDRPGPVPLPRHPRCGSPAG